MLRVHIAYFIWFSQNLEIGACVVLGKCVPRHALEKVKCILMFRVDTENPKDSKSFNKHRFCEF